MTSWILWHTLPIINPAHMPWDLIASISLTTLFAQKYCHSSLYLNPQAFTCYFLCLEHLLFFQPIPHVPRTQSKRHLSCWYTCIKAALAAKSCLEVWATPHVIMCLLSNCGFGEGTGCVGLSPGCIHSTQPCAWHTPHAQQILIDGMNEPTL